MQQTPSWLGLDIGGANLKAANAEGFAAQRPFELWRRPEGLADAIAVLAGEAPPSVGWAVTMTGELADCYATKADGVASIVAAAHAAAGDTRVEFYGVDGQFHGPAEAAADWQLVAAANWHALGSAAARRLRQPALLIDIGSTTTDVVPLARTGVATLSRTDSDRLLAGELVYQGVGRTPISALVDKLAYRGSDCPVAAELFATTADAALLAGRIGEDASATGADGRPMTKRHSHARFARMICADVSECDLSDATAMAEVVVQQMRQKLATSINRVLERQKASPQCYLLSGAGSWLARETLSDLQQLPSGPQIRLLEEELGSSTSTCAPAWAVAVLRSGGG